MGECQRKPSREWVCVLPLNPGGNLKKSSHVAFPTLLWFGVSVSPCYSLVRLEGQTPHREPSADWGGGQFSLGVWLKQNICRLNIFSFATLPFSWSFVQKNRLSWMAFLKICAHWDFWFASFFYFISRIYETMKTKETHHCIDP